MRGVYTANNYNDYNYNDYYSGDKTEKNKIGGARSKHEEQERCLKGFGGET
jgi:hypothetical protein